MLEGQFYLVQASSARCKVTEQYCLAVATSAHFVLHWGRNYIQISEDRCPMLKDEQSMIEVRHTGQNEGADFEKALDKQRENDVLVACRGNGKHLEILVVSQGVKKDWAFQAIIALQTQSLQLSKATEDVKVYIAQILHMSGSFHLLAYQERQYDLGRVIKKLSQQHVRYQILCTHFPMSMDIEAKARSPSLKLLCPHSPYN